MVVGMRVRVNANPGIESVRHSGRAVVLELRPGGRALVRYDSGRESVVVCQRVREDESPPVVPSP